MDHSFCIQKQNYCFLFLFCLRWTIQIVYFIPNAYIKILMHSEIAKCNFFREMQQKKLPLNVCQLRWRGRNNLVHQSPIAKSFANTIILCANYDFYFRALQFHITNCDWDRLGGCNFHFHSHSLPVLMASRLVAMQQNSRNKKNTNWHNTEQNRHIRQKKKKMYRRDHQWPIACVR